MHFSATRRKPTISTKPIMKTKTKTSTRKGKKATSLQRSRRLSLVVLVIVFIFILSFFLSGNKSLFTLYSLYKEEQELIEEKKRLEEKNKQLQEKIKKLEDDIDYIEKVAREKYNLKKENEDVYKVVPED